MTTVHVNQNEPLEKALRRFKKKIEREGLLRQLKERKHYEKPSEKKRRKQRASQSKRRVKYGKS
ncbi:MAG: 30S ribosomal protein S21 [Candidatus Omnitrophica bacterium]|nr:30S ribosomal protein S21 [Candidatus Omnitrophota bacterium]